MFTIFVGFVMLCVGYVLGGSMGCLLTFRMINGSTDEQRAFIQKTRELFDGMTKD